MFDENFPIYTGDKDRTLGRKMLEDLGDTSGFRTRISNNQDGSTTMLRTKGGFPQFTTVNENKAAELQAVIYHGVVVKMNDKAGRFYTDGTVGGWQERAEPAYQKDVSGYWCGEIMAYPDWIPVTVSLSTGNSGVVPAYRWDTSRVSIEMGEIPYDYQIPSNGLFNFIPVLESPNYGYATPRGIYDHGGSIVGQELDAEQIGTIDTALKVMPPVVARDGSHVSHCAYRKGVLSIVAGVSQYNFSSIRQSLSGPLEPVKNTTVITPSVLDSGYSMTTDVGPLSSYSPRIWYKFIEEVPGWGSSGGFHDDGLGLNINYVIGYSSSRMATVDESSKVKSGWHTIESWGYSSSQVIAHDRLPASATVTLSYPESLTLEQAGIDVKIAEYDTRTVGKDGYGQPSEYSSQRSIDFSNNANSSIVVSVGDMDIPMFETTGSSTSYGRNNLSVMENFSDTEHYTYPYFGDYGFVGNGVSPTSIALPLTLEKFEATYEKIIDKYGIPSIKYQTPPAQIPDVSPYSGSAEQTATGLCLLDCDHDIGFVAAIESKVVVTASFTASGGPPGWWNINQINQSPHVVTINIVWWWRGVKHTRQLIQVTVLKPPPFPLGIIKNTLVEPSQEEVTRIMRLKRILLIEPIVDQFSTLRSHQGVNPRFAGYSENEEALSGETGVEASIGSVRQKKTGLGMIYRRKFRLTDVDNAIWLLDQMRISDPLSPNPLETNPTLIRPYGYSDALYNFITNHEITLELRDGEEVNWSSELRGPTDAAEYETFCSRV